MIVSFVNKKGRKGCAVSLSLCPRAWGSTCVYLIAFKLPRPLCPVPLPTTISVPFCVFDAINCVHEWKKLFDFWNFYIAKAVFCVETLCKTKNLFCVRGGGGLFHVHFLVRQLCNRLFDGGRFPSALRLEGSHRGWGFYPLSPTDLLSGGSIGQGGGQ